MLVFARKCKFASLCHTAGESSDVTLVCDDQVKFKAHKFVLKACSPVFESILQETNDLKSVIYLRGVNQLELKPILDFIYSGQACFQQERMKEFLDNGKDLQINEIKHVPDDENTVIEENVIEIHQDIIPEDVSSEYINSVDETKKEKGLLLLMKQVNKSLCPAIHLNALNVM